MTSLTKDFWQYTRQLFFKLCLNLTPLCAGVFLWPGIAKAAPVILGSSLSTEIPDTVQDASALQAWYLARGYAWVKVAQQGELLVVREYPLKQIVVIPEKEKFTIERYIRLKYGEPVNKILLEEQLQTFYQSEEFQERYAKLTVQPDIHPDGMVLNLNAEMKPYSEILLQSRDARGPALYGATRVSLQSGGLELSGSGQVIFSRTITFFGAGAEVQIQPLLCRSETFFFRDELFQLQDGRARLAFCPFRFSAGEFYTGYRLDSQSGQPAAHQLSAGLRWSQSTWQNYNNYAELELGYEAATGRWRFWNLVQGVTPVNRTLALSGKLEMYNRGNMTQPLNYLPYRSHEKYVSQNATLSVFPHVNLSYLRLGPYFESRPLTGEAALAASVELVLESFYGRFYAGFTEHGAGFVRLFAESRL